MAVATDQVGDVFIADSGDQSILELPVSSGSDYGTSIAAGGIAAIVGEGGNGPYLEDGLPALSQTAELNDPEGIAVSVNRNALHHRRQSALHQGGAELHLHGARPLDAGRGPLHPGRGAPVSNSTGLVNRNPLDTHAHGRPDGHHGVDVRHRSLQRPQYSTGAGRSGEPIDRRTFLATGVRTSAAVAVAACSPDSSMRRRPAHRVWPEHPPRPRAWWRRISR